MHLTEAELLEPVDIGTTATGITPYDKGVITGRELWSPMLIDHPNSAMYKVAMQSMWFMAGIRAGSIGLVAQGELLDYQRGIIASIKELGKKARAS